MSAPRFFCTSLHLHNWRNFKGPLDMELRRRVFLIGPNASGKSNLLDALRFLRDIATDGLQEAVKQRGGMEDIRTRQATSPSGIELGLSVGTDRSPEIWKYRLGLRNHPKKERTEVVKEDVWHRGEPVLRRPDAQDKKDRDRLTQTHLEQTSTNRKFRQLTRFLQSIRYRHIVPHLVRAPERAVNGREDPFGSDFLEKLGSAPENFRNERLHEINRALSGAIPKFDILNLQQDTDGRWHLNVHFRPWNSNGSRQCERALSDGTLRLFGLLWSFGEGGGPLLLEEPELGLNDAVVRHLPRIMARAYTKSGPQVLVSTHSGGILADEGIDFGEVHVLNPGNLGTSLRDGGSYQDVRAMMKEDCRSLGYALLPKVAPERGHLLDSTL